ncbi:hypothetical protein ACFLZ5_00540 [Thermodesulfobacteriota bacterium]
MNTTIKIALSIICAFSLSVLFTVYIGSVDGETTGNTLNSIYECDRDNDGVVDAVYHYTYDINGTEIKVAVDSDNDGLINEVCCYNLSKDI